MSLFWATFLVGILTGGLGATLAWNGPPVRRQAFAFLRSEKAAMIFFGIASAWFLWHIWTLRDADFGNLRPILFPLFTAVAIGSFFFVPDFLSVRGVCGLILLAGIELRNAAYMQFEEPLRLFMVAWIFVLVVLALYIGTFPYVLRNFFEWLWDEDHLKRPRRLGYALAAYGLLLLAISFVY